MNNKQSFLNYLLKIGVHEDTPFIEVQKTYMFNLFLLVGFPFAAFSLIVNIYGHYYLPALLNIVQMTIFGIGFRISYLQKWFHLRAGLLLVLAAIAFVSAYYYKNGSEYRLLIMMIAAVVLFDKNWQYLLFALLVSLIFVITRLDDMPLAAMPGDEIVSNIFKILLPLFLFVMCLFYFKHIYFKNLAQLEKANRQLSLAKEQKEKILNAVAHDLRSPISNIASISKMMLQNARVDEDQRELIKLIEHSSDTSLTLINDLMQNSNDIIDPALLEEVDLCQLIRQLIPMLQFRANEKNISIQTEICHYPLTITIDPDRIERVITNLVNNAIKFSHEKSIISIFLRQEEVHALIIVKDQGIGIENEKHEEIFDMFTKAKRKGTAGEKSFGLGLSICKQLIEQHRGSISVESEAGKGSSFIVRLPLRSQS
jgi:signal transduction histidine kinase